MPWQVLVEADHLAGLPLLFERGRCRDQTSSPTFCCYICKAIYLYGAKPYGYKHIASCNM